MRGWLRLGSCLGLIACGGMTVNLGGSEEDESGSQPATSAAVDSGTSTIAPTSVSCAGVSSTTTLSDGTGFNANIPPACSAADGPTQTPTSVAQYLLSGLPLCGSILRA
jgi:hypothetical protein